MADPGRLFAVIPAAGQSRRMGRPKLLLDFGGRTVIRRLLDVLDRPDVADRIVVVRPDDELLRAEVAAAGARIVQPEVPPPEMRQSVEAALAEIRRVHDLGREDGWLLIPGDHPLVSSALLDELIAAWRRMRPGILVPVAGGRRGHPVLFSWELAVEVAALPPDCGLNRLLRERQDRVRELPVADRGALLDLDTPADYEALRKTWSEPVRPPGRREHGA